jgi:hypothetical protein
VRPPGGEVFDIDSDGVVVLDSEAAAKTRLDDRRRVSYECPTESITVTGKRQGVPIAILAAQSAVAQAGPETRPRYLLHVDGNLVALIDTGLTNEGKPDHAAAADFLNRLYTAPTPDIDPHAFPCLI